MSTGAGGLVLTLISSISGNTCEGIHAVHTTRSSSSFLVGENSQLDCKGLWHDDHAQIARVVDRRPVQELLVRNPPFVPINAAEQRGDGFAEHENPSHGHHM